MSGGPSRRAFVTGATGGIGSVLCDRLADAGWEVRALVGPTSDPAHLTGMPRLTLAAADLFDESSLAESMGGADAVFHLAATVHHPAASVADCNRVNVDGTRAVANAAVVAGVSAFVLFSTVAVYPESDDMLDEQSPVGPLTPYGTSKLAAEAAVLSMGDAMRVTVLRLPVVYGPRDRGNVRRLIDAIARGRFVIPGSGDNIKSMVSIENVTRAAIHVAADPRAAGKTYIVADPHEATLNEIVIAISRALGKTGTPRRAPTFVLRAAGSVADLLKHAVGITLPVSADQIDKLAGNTRFSSDRIQRELGVVLDSDLDANMAAAVAGYRLSLL